MRKDSSAFKNAFAVIMAGGSGTRFWPLSRRRHPKQLLKLAGRETLLEQTLDRISPAIPPERTYVFTNTLVRDEIVKLLPRVPKDQIVAEPAARNTTPTIGLAAHEILRRDPGGIMVVLPADHVIGRPAEFRHVLRAACRWADVEGRSVTVGLKPTRPDTGYGYIRLGALAKKLEGESVLSVEKFTEKPNPRLARRYVRSGRYLWNGGMFIWRALTLLENLERFQPALAGGLRKIAEAGGARNRAALGRWFPQLEKISIDYALMEKISNVFVVPADLDWSDVGSWEVVYGLRAKDHEGNVRPERSVSVAASRNMIVSPDKLVVTVGVENLVIVETKDALLVCAREASQNVGKAVQELEKRGWDEYL